MRYVVVETRGYGGVGGRRASSSYSVLDTAHAHREVYWRYVGRGRSDDHCRDDCLREAERLNALDLGRPLARHERDAILRPAA